MPKIMEPYLANLRTSESILERLDDLEIRFPVLVMCSFQRFLTAASEAI